MRTLGRRARVVGFFAAVIVLAVTACAADSSDDTASRAETTRSSSSTTGRLRSQVSGTTDDADPTLLETLANAGAGTPSPAWATGAMHAAEVVADPVPIGDLAEGGSPLETTNGAGNDVDVASYGGTVSTTVAYYDWCTLGSEPRYLGERTYELDVDVYVSAPMTDGAATEDNPFNLGVHSTSGYEGATTVTTAQVFTTPETLRHVMLQYWQLEANGTEVRGTLTDSHRREGTVLNLLSSATPIVACRPEFGTYPMEFPIGEGAALQGTITDDEVELELTGVSTDRQRAFRSVVTGVRSD